MVDSGSNKRAYEADPGKEEHGDMKRQATTATVAFRVLCPNARAGSVLGKGGDVIAKLRNETDARIKMEDRVTGCEERVVTISSSEGNAPESDEYCPAQLALFRVIQKVIEAGEPEAQPLARLLVPQGQIGALVGKGGSIISGFREESGAVIRVLGNTDVPLCAVHGEEVVQVSGDLDKVVHALQLISAQLRTNPPRNTTPVPMPSAASQAGGGGGSLSSGLSAAMAAAGGGGSSAQAAAVAAAAGVPLGGESMDSKFQILVATARAGAIIGRHGDQINALRRETGAAIKVHEVQPGVDERVVEVKSNDDVAAAYCAAQEAVLRIGAALLSEGDVHTLRLLVPASQVGGLVGKGGMRIRSIRQETGTDVRVTSGNSGGVIGGAGAAEVVEMNGPPVPCLHALKTVTSVLRICQAREQRKRVLPAANAAAGLFNPLAAVGGMGGPGGGMGGGGGPLGLGPQHHHHHGNGPTGMHHHHHALAAAAAVNAAAHHHGYPPVSLASALQGGNGMPLGLGLGGGGMGGGMSPPSSRGRQPGVGMDPTTLGQEDHGAMALMGGNGGGGGAAFSLGGLPALRTAPSAGGNSSLRVAIPKEHVGAVLGHGGSNIQQIRALSGAKVKLHNSEGGGHQSARQLEISGSYEQLQAAQGLLQSFLMAAQQAGGA